MLLKHMSIFTLFMMLLSVIDSQMTCHNKQDGFYPHPSDCTSYFICAVGLVYHVRCASGLYFNSRTKYCDRFQSANCVFNPVVSMPQTNAATLTTSNPATIMIRTAKNTSPNLITQTSGSVSTLTTTTKHHASSRKQLVTTGIFPYWIFTSGPPKPTQKAHQVTSTPQIVKSSPWTIHPTFPQILTNRLTMSPPRTTTTPVQLTITPNAGVPVTTTQLQLPVTYSKTSRLTLPAWMLTTRPTGGPTFTQRPVTVQLSRQPSQTPKIHSTIRPTNLQPTLGSNRSNFCKKLPNGFYKDPMNCGFYFHCAYAFTYWETCPTGLVFNDAQKACDWTFNVPQCQNTG